MFTNFSNESIIKTIGIYIILAAIVCTILGGVALTFDYDNIFDDLKETQKVQEIDDQQIEKASTIIGFILFFVAGLNFIIGAGILYKQNWARFLLIITSGYTLLLGTLSLFMFLVSVIVLITTFHIYSLIFFLGSLLLVTVLAAIPLYIIIFLSKKPVKSIFESDDNIPIVVKIIALLLGLTGLSGIWGFCILIFSDFLGAEYLSSLVNLIGPFSFYSLISIYLIHSVVALYAAIKILKLKKKGWYASISLYSYDIIIGIYSFFILGQEELTNLLLKFNHFSEVNISTVFSLGRIRIFKVIVLLICATILVYLYMNKYLFFSDKPSKNKINRGNSK